MIKEEYRVAFEKLDFAARLLEEKGIDCWLILTREGSDPSAPLMLGTTSVHQAGIFIKRDGRHIVLASPNDRGNFETTGLFSEIITYGKNFEEKLIEIFNRINPGKLALNFSKSDNLCDGLTVGQYMILEKAIGKEKLLTLEVSSEEILKELRSIKTPAEIERIKKAVDYTIEIYDEVFEKIKCGMTEKEIGQLFVEGMKKRGVTNGIDGPNDPPIVCIVRAGLAHRKPGNTPVLPGDILIMDFSVKYMDYVSDIARTVYFLKPGETSAPYEVQHAFETAVGAISKVIDFIAPGKKGYEVDEIGRKHIEKSGYPTVRHSVGHQIGRQCHDGGTLLGPRKAYPRPEVEGVIKAGEVYAIEPTVIQDGGLPCMLVEENVAITEEEVKILSRRQLKLVTIS